MQLPAYDCSNCGAPLTAPPGASLVICVYCRRSFCAPTEQAGAAVVPPLDDATAIEVTPELQQLTPSGVTQEQADDIIKLVVAGQRIQAISLYESVARVDTARATAAVNTLMDKLCSQLTDQLPLNRVGGFVLPPTVVALVVGSFYSAKGAIEVSGWYWGPAVLTFSLAWFASKMLWKGAAVNLALLRGGQGEAVVLRKAILGEYKRFATVLVQWHVHPNDGSESFIDEEAMRVAPEALHKLAEGNVVAVHFNRSRDRVFPFGSPMKVLREAKPTYVSSVG